MNYWIDIFFLTYFVFLNGTNTMLIGFSVLEMMRRKARWDPNFEQYAFTGASTPPITILAPAFNEQASIIDSIRAFLQLDYPDLRIIIVNDGSTDSTFELLMERFKLKPHNMVIHRETATGAIRGTYQSANEPRLWVVDKVRGGKSDALNAGINMARTPLVCTVDSDTLADRKALLKMVQPFIYDERNVAAVGGTVRLANGNQVRDGQVKNFSVPQSWLARFQIVEYLRAFLLGRLGYNLIGGNVIISGAFGLFRRDSLVQAGGYRTDTVGEDMEIVVRLHRSFRKQKLPYKVVQIPEPVCYTEVPETLTTLSRQRDRWQRGLAETMWTHRGMIFNPRYGAIGMVVFPIFLLFELLSPLIELAGYLWFGLTLLTGYANIEFAIMFTFTAFVWGFLLTMQSLILDDLNTRMYRGVRMRFILLLAALFENFGYRQLTLYFRLKGLVKFLLGKKQWGKMSHKGFEKVEASKS